MRLVLTGGGTGGHVYPAIAIAEACARDAALAPLEVSFVGTRGGIESRIVPTAGFPIAFVCAAPLERRVSLSLFVTVAANVFGFLGALATLHRARPDVLVATGGYVAFPVVAAMRLVRTLRMTRARIALLEANAAAGLANRLLAPLVDEIWYATAPARALRANETVTGMPVRASLLEPIDARTARRTLGIDEALTTIVFIGGSQGARSLNEAVAGLIESGMPPGWQIVVLAGERDVAALARRLGGRERVHLLAYLDDPHAAYAAADIVVARSGASTLAELAATGTPAILVPYPHATDDHQMHNARAHAAGGAAVVLPDRELDAVRLHRELEAALSPEKLSDLRATARTNAGSDPTATIVARVKALASTNGSVP
ncbi:MAG: UDP-N-acetylglucosamine--N-acetylmuramyl-(pentapeptide) pyrophosphoryl-undecaprenol N-acetylglucosamine transferase [Candidatus Eremiobacteraeota bacterium]|nr:UDP-N-acetylglucosamine--N-acetylmuramyl-(pentapeptide) pyrophosphoryl-undecaprenol N-acetylglucosamine transferase [Candidatus Eremiobacteraeota bacterium]